MLELDEQAKTEMYAVIRDRLGWQLNDSRIRWTEGGYVVFPSRYVLASRDWASIAASSIRESGYRVELLDNWCGSPAVRVSL